MIELTVVIIASILIGVGWVALCIDNMKGITKGVCMAIGLPLMVITMFSLFGYVVYCFHTVLS